MAYLGKTRVRTIMKTADGADTINREAVLLATYATELFIRTLVKEGYKDTNSGSSLDYHNIVNIIHNSSRYEFLETVIPKKITVREFKELMAKNNRQETAYKLNTSINKKVLNNSGASGGET